MNTEMITKHYEMYKPVVAEAGYELIHESPNKYNLLVVKLRNGIKVEIRYKKYKGRQFPIILAAWKHKQLEIIKQWFEDNNYEEPEKTHAIKDSVNTKFLTIDNFIDICKKLEDVDGIIASATRGRGWSKEKAFLGLATMIKGAVDTECPGYVKRPMFDDLDSIVAVNDPLEKDSYREHVVPIKMLIDESIRMFEDGKLVEEVEKMLENNLAVVHITKEQARHLDIDLGLRTSMPAGWKFGDNIFARLEVANIDY